MPLYVYSNFRYNSNFGFKKNMIGGLGTRIIYGVHFCTYRLAFWYGARLVRESLEKK